MNQKFRVGAMPSPRASTLKTASTAPLLPSRCPVDAQFALTAIGSADDRVRGEARTDSTTSPTNVLVAWALMWTTSLLLAPAFANAIEDCAAGPKTLWVGSRHVEGI